MTHPEHPAFDLNFEAMLIVPFDAGTWRSGRNTSKRSANNGQVQLPVVP
jgi:hypothetical protein